MNVANHLLEYADPRTSALVSESHQFSYAELRDAAARVLGEFLLLFCPKDKPDSVPDALHRLQAALRTGTRQLDGQFQLPVIGKPAARKAVRLAVTHDIPSIEQQLRNYIAQKILFASRFPYGDETSFLESGIIDSLKLLDILLHIEKVYHIRVADDEIVLDNFDSVSKIADFIRHKTGQTSAV